MTGHGKTSSASSMRALPLAEERARLIDFIWKGSGLPSGTIDSSADSPHDLPPGADDWKIWTISDSGGRGGSVVVDWVTPSREENGKVLLVHAGHIATWWMWAPLYDLVVAALAQGFCVVGLAMPTYAPNPNPETLTVGGVPTDFVGHTYSALDSDGGKCSACQFLDPVIRSINQSLIERPGYAVHMTGHSGGGWTTEMAAAVDTRILYSASIQGSIPWSVDDTYSWQEGDWETFRSCPIYGHGAIHFTRHAMRSQGRHAINIMADADWVFSSSGHHEALLAFAEDVNGRITQTDSGSYVIVFDDIATTHTVSSWAIAKVLSDIAEFYP